MAKGQQRDPKKEAFWRSALGRFSNSGLSIRAFCQREKVTEPAFYAWRRVVQERDAEQGPPVGPQEHRRPRRDRKRRTGPAFVPLLLRDGRPEDRETGITVELRGGRVLRLPLTIVPERLAELVRAIESVSAEARS